MESFDRILKFWFGRVEETIVPSENRARIWFGEDPEIDSEIKEQFNADLEKAMGNECKDWQETSRGQLALIILLDQFSRHVYRNTPKAYDQDDTALAVCLAGIHNESEHSLSLIERVFYYFPLLHSEKIEYQEQSLRVYHTLADMSFSETRVIFDSFFKFANHHYTLIHRFGRFPQRNAILGRDSSPEELAYLKETQDK